MADSQSPAQGEHVFRTADGFDLQYFVRGSGPLAVVLPPAWGIGSFYLQDGFAELENQFTLVYLEFRSNARSTRREAELMTVWHLVDDVESLRQELNLDKIPRLMGHSGGGTVALWYAIRYPHKVTNLLLLNHRLEGFNDSESSGAALAEKKQDPRLQSALEAGPSTWDGLSDTEFAKALVQFLPVYFYDPSVAPTSSLASLATAPLWNYQMLHGKDRPSKQQEDQLDKVQARTLMIFSQDDPITTPIHGIVTKKGIMNSDLVVYEKCGHFPWMEKKEETLSDIVRFFS